MHVGVSMHRTYYTVPTSPEMSPGILRAMKEQARLRSTFPFIIISAKILPLLCLQSFLQHIMNHFFYSNQSIATFFNNSLLVFNLSRLWRESASPSGYSAGPLGCSPTPPSLDTFTRISLHKQPHCPNINLDPLPLLFPVSHQSVFHEVYRPLDYTAKISTLFSIIVGLWILVETVSGS